MRKPISPFRTIWLGVTLLLLVAVASLATRPEVQAVLEAATWRRSEPQPVPADLMHRDSRHAFEALNWKAGRDPRSLLAQSQAAQQVDLSKISPVVQVAAFNGTTFLKAGSGTIIHPGGLILTNFHVISDAQGGCENVQGTPGTLFVVLVTEQGKENDPPVPKFTAVRIPGAEDPEHDLALLKLDQQVTGIKDLEELKKVVAQLPTLPLPADLRLPFLGLWDSSVLQEGRRLVAQGYPNAPEAGLPRLTTSRGPVFKIEPEPPAQPKFLFIENIFTIHGISGGPVIDAESNLVVGIMCGTAVPEKRTQEPMERAVLINLAQPLLRKAPQRVNQVPVADFSWQPLNPKVGTMVTFDASGSRDLDGTIAKYEWDFTGDGKPDATGLRVTFTIPSDQDLSITLTVMDNEGAAHSRAKRVILQHQAIGVVKIGEQAFPSIQDAIQVAKPNDVIIIAEGQRQENLIIEGKQNLTLRGAGSDKMTLFGTGERPVILIRNSQQIMIEGFTIRDGLVGIRVDNSQVILEENAIIKNLGRGVELVGATAELVRNRLEDNSEEGLMVRGSAVEVRDNTIRRNKGGGILIRDTARDGEFLKVVLRDNVLEENRIVGVAVARNSSAEIIGGHIEKTQQDDHGRFGIGLEVESSFQAATVQEITIMDNAAGGVMVKGLSKGSKVSFVKATIMNNAGNGVMIKEEGQVSFAKATISSNKFFGLIMWGSTKTEIKDNSQILDNGYSGILALNSAQVTIENSQISSNGWHGVALGDFAQANIKNAQISDNKGDGVSLWWGSVKAEISNTQILSNGLNGINLYNFATAIITHNRILKNGWYGISMGHSVKATIRGNQILDNQACGIRVWSSKARVHGDNNQVRGNGADLCHYAPSFLRLPLVPQTSSASLNVPGDYPTIQEAIDAIAPGGTITLAAGTYEEGLTIWKPLVLRGMGSRQTTLKALAGRKLVVSITAEAQGVSLEELTITGSAWNGLWLQGRATITNVRILGNEGDGIEMEGFASATISNTQVSNNNGNGIDIWEANATISSTQISNNRNNGIIMANASSAIIMDSKVLNNEKWGIVLWLAQCGFKSDSFIGQVSGSGNEITGNGEKLSQPEKDRGDGKGDVCPKELEFLKKK
jgi:hypothetical protein